MEIKIIDASWHRNGISGEGFYAVIFEYTDEEQESPRKMVASLFDESGYCAVYAIDELVKGNIAFARGNSWRGDKFEGQLRKLIKEYETGRIGPWSMIPPDVAVEETQRILNENKQEEQNE